MVPNIIILKKYLKIWTFLPIQYIIYLYTFNRDNLHLRTYNIYYIYNRYIGMHIKSLLTTNGIFIQNNNHRKVEQGLSTYT